jgi:hypothetical protein
MFGPSISIFFIFLLLYSSNKKTFYSLWFILLFTIIGFINESQNWLTSKKIQDQVVNDKVFDKIDSKKNLVLFHGPCFVNGVEIFNASWDLGRYLKKIDLKYLNSTFVPIQNWDIFVNDIDPSNKKHNGEKFIHSHTYIYKAADFDKLLIINYYDKSIN